MKTKNVDNLIADYYAGTAKDHPVLNWLVDRTMMACFLTGYAFISCHVLKEMIAMIT